MVGKIHITIPTLKLKRFIREYAVALCGTLLFLLLLTSLVVSRYYALAGLGDLSKINPLITTEGNNLVGRDRALGALTDPNANDAGPSTTNNTAKPSQQPSSTNTNNSTSSPSKQSSGSSTTPNSGSTSPAPTLPFAISIGTMTQVAGSPSGILGAINPVCTITHQFTASIHATNGPGTMTYTWIQSNNKTSSTQRKDFAAGTSDDQVTYQWTISANSGDYWVKLSASPPDQTEKTLNFRHQCIL